MRSRKRKRKKSKLMVALCGCAGRTKRDFCPTCIGIRIGWLAALWTGGRLIVKGLVHG